MPENKRPEMPPHPRTRKGAAPISYYARVASKREMLNQAGADCTVKNLKRRKSFMDCEDRNGVGTCDDIWAPHIDKETCRVGFRKRRKKITSTRKK